MATGFFPGGRRAAVSWSFDDARLSQIDVGMEVFARLRMRATFYVGPSGLEKRREGWKKMLAAGHEIGNHTFSHPCTGNFGWIHNNALEDYTLERMAADIARADAVIDQILGLRPVTFAYPCGQTYVGRGRDTRSYVPLIAERFLVGRGYLGEAFNDPERCDVAQAFAFGGDDLTFEALKKLVDGALDRNAWVNFAGHEIGAGGYQVTRIEALEKFATYCQERAGELYVGTVAEVGKVIQEARSK